MDDLFCKHKLELRHCPLCRGTHQQGKGMRRFAIVETHPVNPWREILLKDTITEDEFKKRLELAKDELTREVPNYDEAIDIMLDGEMQRRWLSSH